MASMAPRERARALSWLAQSGAGEATADDLTVYDVALLGRLPHQAWLAPPGPADHAAVERALRQTQAWDWQCRPLGALSGGASDGVLAQLDTYADALGLAFQIRDDVLDVEGDAGQLGKTAGKDAAQGKSTYPGLLGLAAARERLAALDEAMQLALAPLGANADALRMLAQYAIARAH